MTAEPQAPPGEGAGAPARKKRRIPPGLSPWYGGAVAVVLMAGAAYVYLVMPMLEQRRNEQAFSRFQECLRNKDWDGAKSLLGRAVAMDLKFRDDAVIYMGERDCTKLLAEMQVDRTRDTPANTYMSQDGRVLVTMFDGKVWSVRIK